VGSGLVFAGGVMPVAGGVMPVAGGAMPGSVVPMGVPAGVLLPGVLPGAEGGFTPPTLGFPSFDGEVWPLPAVPGFVSFGLPEGDELVAGPVAPLPGSNDPS